MKSSILLISAVLSSTIAQPIASPLAYAFPQDSQEEVNSRTKDTVAKVGAVGSILGFSALAGITTHHFTKGHYRKKIAALEAQNAGQSLQRGDPIRVGTEDPQYPYEGHSRLPSSEATNPAMAAKFKAIDKEVQAFIDAEVKSTMDNEGRTDKLIRLLAYCALTRVSWTKSSLMFFFSPASSASLAHRRRRRRHHHHHRSPSMPGLVNEAKTNRRGIEAVRTYWKITSSDQHPSKILPS